jgi:hypothetical protein
MATIDNRGVMVTGHGTLHAQQIAAGDHAHAQGGAGTEAGALAELQARLDELLERMREQGAAVPPGAEAAVVTVRDELARPQPNKMVVTAVLDKVSDAVKAVGSLAGLAKTVQDLAGAIL